MIFSKLYTISEELRVGVQCSTPCGYQGWEAFGNPMISFASSRALNCVCPISRSMCSVTKLKLGRISGPKSSTHLDMNNAAIAKGKLFDLVLNGNLRIGCVTSNIHLVNAAIATRSVGGHQTQQFISVYWRRMS